jgi:hypothetical protein
MLVAVEAVLQEEQQELAVTVVEVMEVFIILQAEQQVLLIQAVEVALLIIQLLDILQAQVVLV